MTANSTCTFGSRRGHNLSARIDHPTGPVLATAVFAHCFTCSKDLKAARRLNHALAKRGFAVLSFDFTGLGASDGSFAETTFTADVDDLVAATEYLGGTLMAPSLLVGHSLGGAAVLRAAARVPSVRAVATIGAPADIGHITHLFADGLDAIRSQGSAQVSIGGRPFVVGSSFVDDVCDQRLLKDIASLDAALLFLHAPSDQIVGIDNAKMLFEAARHPKSFVSLDDADHLLSAESDSRYAAEVISSWAGRYVAQSETTTDTDTHSTSYADTTTTATNTGGLAVDVSSRGFTLRVDEPTSVGGTETGPTPYDYLAAALASCTSLTIRVYAERYQMNLEEVATSVTFDRIHATDCQDCEHKDGRIERFDRTVRLLGDLTEDDRGRLLAIAARCPVHQTLEGQVEVHTTLTD